MFILYHVSLPLYMGFYSLPYIIDKWSIIDGIRELVPNPKLKRQPKQNFIFRIKGINSPRITKDDIIKN